MPDIRHRITIAAPPARVYDAVATQKGLQSWWTADVQAESRVGSVAEFGFQNHAIVFRMRIVMLDRPNTVEWSCLGDVDEWAGTTLVFRLTALPGDLTQLDFLHVGWRSADDAYPMCNTDWGRLMYFLKDHVEGRGTGPMMR